jgi:hypothetical protein
LGPQTASHAQSAAKGCNPAPKIGQYNDNHKTTGHHHYDCDLLDHYCSPCNYVHNNPAPDNPVHHFSVDHEATYTDTADDHQGPRPVSRSVAVASFGCRGPAIADHPRWPIPNIGAG